MKRKCDHCKKEYEADMRNLKRGWGLCCSKSCAAKKREIKNGHRFHKMKKDRDFDQYYPFSMEDMGWAGAD